MHLQFEVCIDKLKMVREGFAKWETYETYFYSCQTVAEYKEVLQSFNEALVNRVIYQELGRFIDGVNVSNVEPNLAMCQVNYDIFALYLANTAQGLVYKGKREAYRIITGAFFPMYPMYVIV